MNRKMIFSMVGRIIIMEAALLLLPLITALIYGESCALAILITIGIALVIGAVLTLLSRNGDRTIFAKEGFVIVSVAWVALSMIGALPFTISGEIPSYIDALFEMVSGFTTTGASILADVEAMSKGLLFWRSFSHWIGGMGVLVLILAIVPSDTGRTIHIMRAEVPGPIVGKIVPRIRDTAKILYLMYVALTVVEIILLLCGGMPVFDSIVHSFGTAGTGGFGIKAASIAGYSPYLQWVITVFMLLFGINFNIYYLLLIRSFKSVFKSGELWMYLAIAVIASVVIAVNTASMYATISESVRHAFFQVASIMTTTGYATTDFNLWPTLSKSILLILMFVGACAGSTGGGIKVSRVLLLLKQIRREFRQMLHPRSVSSIQLEGKRVDNKTLSSVSNYLAVYILCFVVIFLIISIEPFSFETNFSAVASCFNNIGPGFDMVGPSSNFAAYSGLSKIVLTIAMLLGRLEIYPIILAVTTVLKPSGTK